MAAVGRALMPPPRGEASSRQAARLLAAPVRVADVPDRLLLPDGGDDDLAPPEQRHLRQRPAGVLGVEPDVIAAVLEVELAAAAVIGVGDLDVGDAERRVAADEHV